MNARMVELIKQAAYNDKTNPLGRRVPRRFTPVSAHARSKAKQSKAKQSKAKQSKAIDANLL